MSALSHATGQVEYPEQFPRADGVYESKAAPVCSNLLANIVNLVEHERDIVAGDSRQGQTQNTQESAEE